MKKLILFVIFTFCVVINMYSIDKYSIDKVKVKVYNTKYDSCYVVNEWQPWQKVNGSLFIDRSTSKIILNLNMPKLYFFANEKVEKFSEDTILNTFYTNNNIVLCLYTDKKDLYLYILDDYNQIEIIYNLNKK